jgi:hypothetical protein
MDGSNQNEREPSRSRATVWFKKCRKQASEVRTHTRTHSPSVAEAGRNDGVCDLSDEFLTDVASKVIPCRPPERRPCSAQAVVQTGCRQRNRDCNDDSNNDSQSHCRVSPLGQGWAKKHPTHWPVTAHFLATSQSTVFEFIFKARSSLDPREIPLQVGYKCETFSSRGECTVLIPKKLFHFFFFHFDHHQHPTA